MPIRLLEFDPTGVGMRFIERSEMFRRILTAACLGAAQQGFQADWMGAHKLSSEPIVTVEESMEDNSKRVSALKDKLITELVERHARYTILSHTWIREAPGDVVYKDWETRTGNQHGYDKIARFCEVAAREHEVAFGWMDTVCINKESSSELDESIRSMYKWYRNAHVCIVYLSETDAPEDMHNDSWFTRGWTLQELLAPRSIQFYNKNWENFLVGRNDQHIQDDFKETQILRQIRQAMTIKKYELELCRHGQTEQISISRRLQLSSTREVTREEDIAYSLMGILGVDISAAYGEGSKRALSRLFRELISSKKDVLDIFNYRYSNDNSELIPSTLKQYHRRSAVFDNDFSAGSLLDQYKPIEPLILTHLGLRIPLFLVPGLHQHTRSLKSVPKGDFHGEFILGDSKMYSLLDRRIYTEKQTIYPNADAEKNPPYVLTLGVLNFVVVDNEVMIPASCLSVPLYCGAIKPPDV